MSRSMWSIHDAKNRFSAMVEAARREPQTVTKHGKPTVVMIAAAEYERLRRLEQAEAPGFADVLLAMPQDGREFPRLKVRPRDFDL